jgi:hypothetical protein
MKRGRGIKGLDDKSKRYDRSFRQSQPTDPLIIAKQAARRKRNWQDSSRYFSRYVDLARRRKKKLSTATGWRLSRGALRRRASSEACACKSKRVRVEKMEAMVISNPFMRRSQPHDPLGYVAQLRWVLHLMRFISRISRNTHLSCIGWDLVHS